MPIDVCVDGLALTVPRPPSLNKILRMHWQEQRRRKRRYVDDVRAIVLASNIKTPIPFPVFVEAEVVVFGQWRRSGSGDADNWMKWPGDALAGFVLHDDGPEYWTYRVTLADGAPSMCFTFTFTDRRVEPCATRAARGVLSRKKGASLDPRAGVQRSN
jgi:Holliday junction resolvase RusA-like endonuclease